MNNSLIQLIKKFVWWLVLLILLAIILYLYTNPRIETITEQVPTTDEEKSQALDSLNGAIIATEKINELNKVRQEKMRKDRDSIIKQLSSKWEQRDRHLNPSLYLEVVCPTTATVPADCEIKDKTLTLQGRKEIAEAQSGSDEEEITTWINIIEE